MSETHRRRSFGFPVVVTTAFVLGASAIGISYAASNADGPYVPPDKQKAFDSAGVVDPSALGPDTQNAGLSTPAPDSGDQATIAAVRKAIPGLFAAHEAPGRLDTSLVGDSSEEQLRASATQVARDEQLKTLTDVLGPAAAQKQLEVYAAGLKQAITSNNPNWLYTDDHFEVTKWEGVQLSGNDAHLLFEGHMTWALANGSLKTDPPLQYEVELSQSKSSSFGWIITNQVGRQVNGE